MHDTRDLEILAQYLIPIVLSYGGGVDSTAILFRIMLDPILAPIRPLLIAMMAMTGQEWQDTAEAIEECAIPMMNFYGIRFVQGARKGESQKDGVIILSDTCRTEKFYSQGPWTLGDHLTYNATVPQLAQGRRLCTLHFKAWVLDFLVRMILGDSPHKRFIGFNADETERIKADKSYVPDCQYVIGYNHDEIDRLNDKSFIDQGYAYVLGFNADEIARAKEEAVTWRKQTFEFPLILWGWGRQYCETFTAAVRALHRQVGAAALTYDMVLAHIAAGEPGIDWKKSYCWYCCALENFQKRMEEHQEYAVYGVRRIFPANGVIRQTKIIFRGTEAEAIAYLKALAVEYNQEAEFSSYSWRFWSLPPQLEGKGSRKKRIRPAVEEMFVVCPPIVVEKQGKLTEPQFNVKWRSYAGKLPKVKKLSLPPAQTHRVPAQITN